MKLSLSQILVNAAVLASLTACGQVLDSVSGSSKDAATPAEEEKELVDIDVNVNEDTETGFALAAASEFNINLEGCASGLTGSANQNKLVLNVYKFDRNCLAKLTALKYGNINYTMSAGVPFTTWQVGDSAIFTDSGSNQIRVSVTAQLSNPVGAADTIGYSFSEIAAGTDQVFSKSVVGAPKSMVVGGQAAPAFLVKSLSYTGIGNTGAGAFSFDLECTTLFVAGTTGLNSVCKDLKLSQLKYILVKDTFSGTLTATQAAALFTSAGSTVAAAIAPSAGGMANGGFSTGTLDGPDQMHLNPNMLLVIEGAGTSYLYFNVDVSTISQADTL